MYLSINNSSTAKQTIFSFILLEEIRQFVPSDYDNVEEELHDHIIMFEKFDRLDLRMTEEEFRSIFPSERKYSYLFG